MKALSVWPRAIRVAGLFPVKSSASTDSGITADVEAKFAADDVVKSLEIDVDTCDGVVFLTGSVGSDAERQQAIQLARDANDLMGVQSNLTLSKS
jgi:hyperosmotically inducible periplasmic protein